MDLSKYVVVAASEADTIIGSFSAVMSALAQII